mmetsp:Transcript_118409/g.339931  ORF Transcript_118409/g.339931 Transcript_118409/m.339931 type:complete len:246 (+) Transcript_118409:1048-1785(+)
MAPSVKNTPKMKNVMAKMTMDQNKDTKAPHRDDTMTRSSRNKSKDLKAFVNWITRNKRAKRSMEAVDKMFLAATAQCEQSTNLDSIPKTHSDTEVPTTMMSNMLKKTSLPKRNSFRCANARRTRSIVNKALKQMLIQTNSMRTVTQSTCSVSQANFARLSVAHAMKAAFRTMTIAEIISYIDVLVIVCKRSCVGPFGGGGAWCLRRLLFKMSWNSAVPSLSWYGDFRTKEVNDTFRTWSLSAKRC